MAVEAASVLSYEKNEMHHERALQGRPPCTDGFTPFCGERTRRGPSLAETCRHLDTLLQPAS